MRFFYHCIMKTAVIAGASGLVGRELATLLAHDHRYGSVVLLVRKPLQLDLPNTRQLLFDYENPDYSRVSGDEFYCCLGTTINKAGSEENFYRVDYQYVVETCRGAVSNGIRKIACISSMGANPHSRIFYNRTKGEMEEALKKLPIDSLHIIRPSLLLGNRSEFRRGERIAQIIMTRFSFLIPKNYRAIHAEKVARAMIYLVNRGRPGIHIHESGELASVPS